MIPPVEAARDQIEVIHNPATRGPFKSSQYRGAKGPHEATTVEAEYAEHAHRLCSISDRFKRFVRLVQERQNNRQTGLDREFAVYRLLDDETLFIEQSQPGDSGRDAALAVGSSGSASQSLGEVAGVGVVGGELEGLLADLRASPGWRAASRARARLKWTSGRFGRRTAAALRSATAGGTCPSARPPGLGAAGPRRLPGSIPASGRVGPGPGRPRSARSEARRSGGWPRSARGRSTTTGSRRPARPRSSPAIPTRPPGPGGARLVRLDLDGRLESLERALGVASEGLDPTHADQLRRRSRGQAQRPAVVGLGLDDLVLVFEYAAEALSASGERGVSVVSRVNSAFACSRSPRSRAARALADGLGLGGLLGAGGVLPVRPAMLVPLHPETTGSRPRSTLSKAIKAPRRMAIGPLPGWADRSGSARTTAPDARAANPFANGEATAKSTAGQWGSAVGGRLGKTTVMEVPRPSLDRRRSGRGVWAASSRQMESPRPLPSILECSSRARRKNGSKIRSTAFGGDARAVVVDGQPPGIPFDPGRDGDGPSRRGVFDRVGDQVAEDLLASRGVGDDRGVGIEGDRLPGQAPAPREAPNWRSSSRTMAPIENVPSLGVRDPRPAPRSRDSRGSGGAGRRRGPSSS